MMTAARAPSPGLAELNRACRGRAGPHPRVRLLGRVGGLSFTELDAEPSAGVVPLQSTGRGDRQAGTAFKTGGILHREGPVGLHGVHVSSTARDDRLPATGGFDDLLVDLDVGLFLIELEAVLRQKLGDRKWFHSARTPASPSLMRCLIFTGDFLNAWSATFTRCSRGLSSRLKTPYSTLPKSSP